jgi:hypothetical protein
MFDDVRRLYAAGRLVPFVGAGVSQAVLWENGGAPKRGPSWDEMIEHAACDLGFTRPSLLLARGTSLQVLEYFKIRHGSLAPLINWLVMELDAPEAAIRRSAIHTALASLECCSTFYTTNYDNYLEKALELSGRRCQVIVEERHMGEPLPPCHVVKFHGDFNNPTTMVLSESDYQKRLDFQHPLDLRLRSDMLGRAVLFIGYSFRDPNVAYLFHLVQKHLADPHNPIGKRAYILFPDPSDFERQLFLARDIGVIPVPAREREEGVADFLRALTR